MKEKLLMYKRQFCLVLVLLLLFIRTQAQIFITYPVPAQGLTQQLDTSLLTVQVSFTATCNNTSATIHFPPGIRYIPGSVVKTGGTASLAIGENGGTPELPVFSITGVTGTSDITFTVKRRAVCGAPISAKDTIVVSGSCGTVTENNPSQNNYTVLTPALSMPAPAALNTAQNYTTFSRNITVTNGGNGCLDTLYFFIVYPQAGILLQSLAANTVPVTAYRTSGDTAFFKVSGTQLSPDGLMCNGETVSFVESGRIVKCNTITTFGARWGHADNANACQTVAATGNLTMSIINQGVTVNAATIQAVGTCIPGIYDLTYNSNGVGADNAGALFDFIGRFNTGGLTLDSVKLLSGATLNPVAYTLLSGSEYQINTNQFTADPDGATGLSDIDGDGRFDDLPAGNNYKIRLYTRWPCPDLANFMSAKVFYNDMCKNPGSFNGLDRLAASPFSFSITTARNELYPIEVATGVPFNITFITTGSFGFPVGSTDTTYFSILIPSGATLSGTGNITLGGNPVPPNRVRLAQGPTAGDPDTLIIASKGRIAGTYSADFVYAGSTTTTLTFGYEAHYISDQSCNCPLAMFPWKYFDIAAQGPLSSGSCPIGISNYAPVVQRQTLGFTDNTMTTRVSASSISGIPAVTFLVRDSMTITQSGINHGSQNNAYYSYQINKSGGTNILSYSHGIFMVKNAISGIVDSCNLPAPADSGTATVQHLEWNLTSCLPAGALNEGDSLWVTVWYAVNASYNNVRTPAAGTNSRLFSKGLAPNDTNIVCNSFSSYFYVTRYGVYTQNYSNSSVDCSVLTFGNSGAARYGTGESLDIYPNEFRPAIIVDSFAYNLPVGYNYSPAMTTVTYSAPGALNVLPAVTISGGRMTAYSGPAGSATYWRPNDLAQGQVGFGNPAISNIRILPTCQASTGLANGIGTYYIKSFAYSDNPGNSTVNVNYPASWPTRPVLAVQNNTGNVQGVLPQHTWDIQINNTGGSASANTWLSLRRGDISSGIVVDSVNLVSSAGIPGTSLQQLVYGQGTWYQVSDTGMAADTGTQRLRVFFHYTRCTADSLIAGVGWNCLGYPADPSSYLCATPVTTLRVIPEPSQVQLNISDQPTQPDIAMCTTDSVTLDVNSALAANVNHPEIVVTPPSGLTLLAPFEVEYPLGSGNWQNIAPVALGSDYEVDLSQHSGIGNNGLPGTVVNPGADGRQVRLKVKYNTACTFVSGSKLDFRMLGVRPCDDPATGNGVLVRSQSIKITGAFTIGEASVSLTSDSPTLSCGGSTIINLSVTPVISQSVTGDTAVYVLPASLQYNNVFTPGANCASCSIVVLPQSNGVTILKVGLPSGVAANTSINFSYGVTSDGGGCGSDSIRCDVERQIPPLICGATTCTSSKIVIGSGFSQSITINKPDLEVNAAQRVSGDWWPSGSGQAAFNYTNNGTQAAPANVYQAAFYCGASVSPFFTGLLTKPVAIGATQRDTFSLNFPLTCNSMDQVSIKVSPAMSNNTIQCLCRERVAIFDVVLPVVLADFIAVATGCTATLSWNTLSEKNSSHFDLERSDDGNRFEKIGKINSYNNSTGGFYTFRYDMTEDRNFFRLKMVDLDGAFTYSKVVVLNRDCRQEIIVMPNPAQNEVTVKGLSVADEIRIISTDGRQVMLVKATKAIELINVSKIAAGLYLLQVYDQQGQQKASLKVNKQ